MGKKKSAVFRTGSSQQLHTDNGKAIKAWDDVEHDSEDEFHEERGNVLLEKDDSDQGEQSEHEIYGLDGIDEDESSEDEEEEEQEEEEVEATTWGTSKKAYYNADEGSDLDEMREEEEEALKIQKQRLAEMDEADFVDDTLPGWGIGTEANKEADRQLVEDVTKDLEGISFDVSASVAARRKNLPVSEKLKILQNESPELLDLLNEFKERSETMKELANLVKRIQQKHKLDHEAAKFIVFQYQLLMNYLTNISFYFTLKAAGTADIRNHPVIGTLVELRGTIEKMETLESKLLPQLEHFINNLDELDVKKNNKTTTTTSTRTKNGKKKSIQSSISVLDQENDIEQDGEEAFDYHAEHAGNDDDEDDDDVSFDESQDDEDERNAHDIEEEFKSLKSQTKKRKRVMPASDFGDLDALDQVDMEDKLAKKRSIRDYVAKIESKQAKQQSKYQGDSDLPYRDRQQKQKKGVAQPEGTSADLDDQEWDEKDMQDAGAGSDEDDYAKVMKDKSLRKARKQAEYDATRAPVMDSDYKVDDGQKRLASWQILKNKGLTPHRKKENKNGRVKKRHQYEQKMKKLSSVRQVVKPLSGTYGGESTGIKSNVSRSVKL